MKTLLLDRKQWDIVLDARGNLAVADGAYALAQDAASAIKLFKGELWFDQNPGIPYFQAILGGYPTREFVRAKFVAAALRVPGVVTAKVFFTGLSNRVLSGQVQVTNRDGALGVATF